MTTIKFKSMPLERQVDYIAKCIKDDVAYTIDVLEEMYSEELFNKVHLDFCTLIRFSLFYVQPQTCSLSFFQNVIVPNLQYILANDQDIKNFIIKFKDFIDEECLNDLLCIYDCNKLVALMLKRQASYISNSCRQKVNFFMKVKGVV